MSNMKDRYVFLKQEYFSMLNILDFRLHGASSKAAKDAFKNGVKEKEKQIVEELPTLYEQLFCEVDKMLDPNRTKKKYTKKPKYYKIPKSQ